MWLTGINTLLLICILGLLLSGTKRSLRRARGGVIIDSCGLIDERIKAIMDEHVIDKPIIIPSFILQELQLLADGKDELKRTRAKVGLLTAKQLQETHTVIVDLHNFPDIPAVDDKLLELAKRQKATLYTTDTNLASVAETAGITVINVNALAQSLRISVLPGETVTIPLRQRGKEHGQAIGYLEDGTLVVVDHAAKLIGKTVSLTVTGVHQTTTGTMVFARISS